MKKQVLDTYGNGPYIAKNITVVVGNGSMKREIVPQQITNFGAYEQTQKYLQNQFP